ncbi:WD repeat-containing and planar cell polarity effector protein fritz [Anopheles ziemanni]|uniref:WD repeat-containing and planar cell polarity effector protein fritz n=1 Tax=Anopheles coustani TaxID=139045 RepID=UPI002659D886|nr:WD repeat-containing and planar cell polarity effector protein fritz [Anopheles coustani]XP_058174001.1 WD repeat-containing and planar cell polarity effector protein fritz [Anopheles ziemanni]
MLTLLTELRFWSTREDICIQDTDLGTTKYCEKKVDPSRTVLIEGKRSYCESRGLKWSLDNKKPNKLRHSLRLLEDELRQKRLVYCKWKNSVLLQLMLANGLLVHVSINPFTGDINRIYFDKYLIGKLISEHITDVVITQNHILVAYNENQITFVQLQKPTAKKNNLEKISLMDPKIYNVLLSGTGTTTRKVPKRLVCSSSLNLVIVWTKSSQNEVYPWRPTVKDQDRANLHVYKLNGARMELLCYYWTEYDPISVEFSLMNDYQVHCVEQKISKKGEVTIDSCIYQINKTKMRRVAVTSIPLQTQVCCNALSPDHEKLMLGCIDGSIVLFDEGRGITHLVKAAFIPTYVAWHSDSSVVMIANEKCQLQCFDIALSCVRMQLLSESEDGIPSGTYDLSNYFLGHHAPSINLARLCWSKKPELANHGEKYATTDSFLFCAFEQGPLACVRVVGGSGLKGDVHTSGLTADVLVHKYISLNQVEKAINILLSLNWDTYGAMCLLSLHRIANYIFKQPLGTERELQLQKALGSFLVPVKSLCYETELEFGDQVNDITLKFFHYLLRNRSYNKAFSLAIDINDADLFLKLHDKAKTDGDVELAREALRKVDDINRICTDRSDSEHSLCSNSSCSLCADSFDDDDDDEDEEETRNNGVEGERTTEDEEEMVGEVEDDAVEADHGRSAIVRRRPATATNGVNGGADHYSIRKERTFQDKQHHSRADATEGSFRTFSTSSGSSKSSQIQQWNEQNDRSKARHALAHPPLPKTGEQPSKPRFESPPPRVAPISGGGASRLPPASNGKEFFVHQDRPPLPYIAKPSKTPQHKPVAPPFAIQRSQTAMALKLSKQQQSRMVETKMKGKSLSSSNLLLLGDEGGVAYAQTSGGMVAPGLPLHRPRNLMNPREKAARYRLYSSTANSLSMDQLDVSTSALAHRGVPVAAYGGEPSLASTRTAGLPAFHHPDHHMHQLQSQQQQQHIVIDVVPKPSMGGPFAGPSSSSSYGVAQSLAGGGLVGPSGAHSVLDQTIGIPLVQDEPDFVRRTVGGGAARKPPLLSASSSSPSSSWFNTSGGAPTSSSNSNNAPRTIIHQYPLISGNIPSKSQLQQQQHQQPPFELQLATAGTGKYGTRKKLDAPTASILSNSSSSVGALQPSSGAVRNEGGGPGSGAINLAGGGGGGGGSSGASSSSSAINSTKRDGGEKNKVKFSDTVTVAVVPEIPRKEKLMVEKLRKQPMPPGPVGYGGPFPIADPKRELAESLPLCHPNEDYLKDFTPMQDLIGNGNGEIEKKEEEKKIPNIKVVHFGVV